MNYLVREVEPLPLRVNGVDFGFDVIELVQEEHELGAPCAVSRVRCRKCGWTHGPKYSGYLLPLDELDFHARYCTGTEKLGHVYLSGSSGELLGECDV